MGKIYCVMGKSSSGKDTLFKLLLGDNNLSLNTIVLYTTRPMREGEQNGVEYYFCDERAVEELQKQGRIIELRSYNTVHGIWKYFTVDDHQVDLNRQSYVMIGTLASYLKIRDYYGKDKVVPLYIEVEDGLRLQRALDREKLQSNPRYEELCRRFLADASDFSEQKLKEALICKRFNNISLEDTVQEIENYVLQKEKE